jgi:hypothetical protein
MLYQTNQHSTNLPPSPERAVLSDPIVIAAATTAQSDFAGHPRKQPKGFPGEPKEFFSHLDAVARTLARHGYGPAVVAAGYLHDHLEDLPKIWNKDRMRQEFGDQVSELVDWVTQQDKGLSWEERNIRYAARLATAPTEALAISAADKLSNISDLIPFLRAGIPVSGVLKRGWQVNSDKFHELLSLFDGRVAPQFVQELREALEVFDRLGAPLES